MTQKKEILQTMQISVLTLTWFSYAFWFLTLKAMEQMGHLSSSIKCSSTWRTSFRAFSGFLSYSTPHIGHTRLPSPSSFETLPASSDSSSLVSAVTLKGRIFIHAYVLIVWYRIWEEPGKRSETSSSRRWTFDWWA